MEWLDKIIGIGSGIYSTTNTNATNAAIAKQQAKASTAQAALSQSQSATWTKIALIGGAVVLVLGIVFLFRKS